MKRQIIITVLAILFCVGIIPASATLYDYFIETEGIFPTVSQRATIANQYGIYPYTGTAGQNILFEALLRAGKLADDTILGSSLPIAGATYNLAGSGISSSAVSLTLASLTITQTGQKITDSNLDDIFYITVEPGSKSRQEIVACTTVTQNSGGTATLSGCSRGMSPITPYTASTTLAFSHAGGSQVIFSNPPQLYNKYTAKTNSETIINSWQFDAYPYASSTIGYATTSYQFITLLQANSIGNQGAATATPAIAGISEEATRIENASSTAFDANNPHFQSSEHSTSTPSANAFTDGVVWDIWSENSGYLAQEWFNLSELWAFSNITSASTTLTGNLLFTGNATSTGNLVGFESSYYGNGTDGDVTISASATTTRDMYYNNLTINVSTTLDTNGYRIFVKGTLTINGNIDVSGGDGGDGVDGQQDGSGGTGGTAGAGTYTGSISGGVAGGVGGAGAASGNGGAGTAGTGKTSTLNGVGVAGGNGGVGQGNTGGTGGTAGTGAYSTSTPNVVSETILMRDSGSTAFARYEVSGGSGSGGGGASDNTKQSGGGGGSGGTGGVILIVARNIVISATGSITSNGGAGGDGGDGIGALGGGGGGGGGGGNGGIVVFIYFSLTNDGSITVSGGAAGVKGVGGATPLAPATDGTVGKTGKIYYLNN